MKIVSLVTPKLVRRAKNLVYLSDLDERKCAETAMHVHYFS